MNSLPLMIKKIYQKDETTFTIEWVDGLIDDFNLSFLQRNCPCARCAAQEKGKSSSESLLNHSEVSAVRINSVGRYALKIQFSTGCSLGIFSYALLRTLGKQGKVLNP